MSFWNTATQEQKLAQIDGGIECGLNAPQIAVKCGAPTTAVYALARYHGRDFSHIGTGQSAKGARARLVENAHRSCAQYKRNSEKYGSPADAAFSIFDNHSEAFELEWPA